MRLELHIYKDSGEVVLEGGAAASAALRLGDTLDLILSFLDNQKNVIQLPEGALGSLVLKKRDTPTGSARILKDGWIVTGSGSTRRYAFSMRVYSGLLLDDLLADIGQAFSLQIEWRIAGKPYNCAGIPTAVELSYIQPGDIPPPVPTAGFPVEWSREVFGPAEEVVSDTRWVGNILLGGPLETVRISCDTWHNGVFVQLKHNGANLFTSPVRLAGQTVVFDVDDVTNHIALANLSAGAVIECVTTFDEGEYGTNPLGLQVELQVIASERSALDTAPTAAFEWLKSRLVAGSNVTLTADNDEETITVKAQLTYSAGFARVVIGSTTYEWPVTAVP